MKKSRILFCLLLAFAGTLCLAACQPHTTNSTLADLPQEEVQASYTVEISSGQTVLEGGSEKPSTCDLAYSYNVTLSVLSGKEYDCTLLKPLTGQGTFSLSLEWDVGADALSFIDDTFQSHCHIDASTAISSIKSKISQEIGNTLRERKRQYEQEVRGRIDRGESVKNDAYFTVRDDLMNCTKINDSVLDVNTLFKFQPNATPIEIESELQDREYDVPPLFGHMSGPFPFEYQGAELEATLEDFAGAVDVVVESQGLFIDIRTEYGPVPVTCNGVNYSVTFRTEGADTSSLYCDDFAIDTTFYDCLGVVVPADRTATCTFNLYDEAGQLLREGLETTLDLTWAEKNIQPENDDETGERVARFYDDIIVFEGIEFQARYMTAPLYLPTEVEFGALSCKVTDLLDTWEKENALFQDLEVTCTYPDDYTLTVPAATHTGANHDYLEEVRKCSAGTSTVSGEFMGDGYSGTKIPFSGMVTLETVLGYAKFADQTLTETDEWYELQTYAPPQNVTIVEYYYESYAQYKRLNGNEPAQKTKSLPGSFFGSFSCDRFGTFSRSLAETGDMFDPELCDVYTMTVSDDVVVSLDVELSLLFGGIIVDEPIDFTGCFVTAHYAHGQILENMPLTLDMVGTYDAETSGIQSVEISFEEGKKAVEMYVRRVQSFTFAEGLEDYYLLGDEPAFDVWLHVVFTDESDDYIAIPAQKFEGFDTSKLGSNSFSLTYGGKTAAHSYQVIEGIYLPYLEGDGGITLQPMQLGKPASDEEKAWIPENISYIVLPEEIGGLPVIKLADNLFANQTILRALTIPHGIQSVGKSIVDGCKNLKTLTLPGNFPLASYFKPYKEGQTFGSPAVYPNVPKGLTIDIDDQSTTLVENFLDIQYKTDDAPAYAELHFGKMLSEMGKQDFRAWNFVEKFTVTDGNAAVSVRENIVFTDSGKTLYFYPDSKEETTYRIPDEVTAVVYMQNQFLEELTVSPAVATIPEDFLYRNQVLRKLTFEAGSMLKEIPARAFDGCTALSEFNFPEQLETIRSYAFGEVAIEKLILPQTLKTLEEYAFYMAKCTHIYVPASLVPQLYQQVQSNPNYDLNMTNLQVIAYDGSIRLENLPFVGDGWSPGQNRTKLTALYITGETAAIGNAWCGSGYSSSFPNLQVYVYPGTDFYNNTTFFPANRVHQVTESDTPKWWL